MKYAESFYFNECNATPCVGSGNCIFGIVWVIRQHNKLY